MCCNVEFILSFAGKKSELYDKTSPDWVPSVNMLPVEMQYQNSEKPPSSRYERQKSRTEKKKMTDAATSLLELGEGVECYTLNIESGTETQTEVTSELLDAMTHELQQLRTENISLASENKTSSKYDRSYFEGKDDRVRYFTGLSSFKYLLILFMFLEAYIPTKKSMDKFQMLVLTLMRLRLNLSITFLSFEFDVSASTVSRIFAEVISVMYKRMKSLIKWPSREELRKTMPMQFRNSFGTKCAVIIDCFEIFIERPSNLKARAQTWSSYKHHNTVKFLIGITPQGTVSFLSKAWGGRTTDRFVTENCKFLNNILPGDLILADRGFDIKDVVGSMMAECKIPAFTKGKDQLSPLDLESTRKIAHLRIHVERVIGMVRQKYTFLNGPLTLDLLVRIDGEEMTMMDQITTVCCALVNFCESVVDFE